MLAFRNGTLCRAFLRAFRRQHHAEISVSKPLRQGAFRLAHVNSEVLSTHFATLEKLIQKNNLDAERNFNLDESGITPERDMHGITSTKRFMSRLGCRDAEMPEFRNLSRVTLMPNISASGARAPPLFLFMGSRLL